MSVNEREEREPLEEALEDDREPREEDELMERVDADLKVGAFYYSRDLFCNCEKIKCGIKY